MNLWGACYILKQAQEGKEITPDVLNKAMGIVAAAQAEFMLIEAQLKENKGDQ